MTREEAIQRAKVLKSLIELNKVSKILDSFLPVFLDKTIDKGNAHWLHGNFNLGGTVSGRLSSSGPNMQQIPSTGSVYAKPVKKCFKPSKEWLLIGADFSSLEDRISALTTKDPNKLKIYTGHIIYEITVNNTCYHIRDDDIISYDGNTYTGESFYEKFNSNSTL